MTQRNCLSGCCVWLATSRPNRSPRASAGQRSTLARGMSTARLLDLMSRPTGCSRGRSHLERGGPHRPFLSPTQPTESSMKRTLNSAKTWAAALAMLCSVGTQAADKVTVQLKWVPQAQFAGYYVAQAKGYYKDAGLDVTIKPGGPDVSPVQVV